MKGARQEILDLLRAAPDGLTAGEIYEAVPPRSDGKFYSDSYLRVTIVAMVEEGLIAPLPGKTYRRRYGLPKPGSRPPGGLNAMSKRQRFDALAAVGCLACLKLTFKVPQRTEIHHQNAGGHAGQKQLGHRFTIPLCGWHHRGEPLSSKTKTEMAFSYGPSLAEQSKAFRATFGSDQTLLAKADELIGWVP